MCVAKRTGGPGALDKYADDVDVAFLMMKMQGLDDDDMLRSMGELRK